MEFADMLRLIHPAMAIVVVFPVLGVVVNRAWLTRSRRLETTSARPRISPGVGAEHVSLGRWLTGSVVGVTLLGLAHPIGKDMLKQQLWATHPFQVVFIGLMFVATITALVCLYKARTRPWRLVLALLTGLGLLILGHQNGVYRREFEWYVSHFYYGMAAALLMVFSLAIVPEIYRDRSQTWRRIHIGLSCVALVLFLGQGMTGVRDLLEIPLGWQESHLAECDFKAHICPPVLPE